MLFHVLSVAQPNGVRELKVRAIRFPVIERGGSSGFICRPEMKKKVCDEEDRRGEGRSSPVKFKGRHRMRLGGSHFCVNDFFVWLLRVKCGCSGAWRQPIESVLAMPLHCQAVCERDNGQ